MTANAQQPVPSVNSGMRGRLVNTRIPRKPPATAKAWGRENTCATKSLGMFDFAMEQENFVIVTDHDRSRSADFQVAGMVDGDGNANPLGAGEFAFVPPHETHQFRNTGDEPFVFICAVPKEYE
mgnify:CR=1 FL=1